MSLETFYQFRAELERAERGFRDLDRVALIVAVSGDEGEALPAGAAGTVVNSYGGGEAYLVEFREPEAGTFATVKREDLVLV